MKEEDIIRRYNSLHNFEEQKKLVENGDFTIRLRSSFRNSKQNMHTLTIIRQNNVIGLNDRIQKLYKLQNERNYLCFKIP